MLTQAPVSDSLEQVISRILASRQITRQDQHHLLNLYDLTAQQRSLINQLFDRFRLGLIRVVD